MVVLAYPAFEWDFKCQFSNFELAVNRDYIVDYNKVSTADLVIFSGGEDINPGIYGEKNTHSYVNPFRDKIELEVLEIALETDRKILGVCRGHQLINGYLGGKLVQDIGSDLGQYHKHLHQLYKTSGVIGEYFFTVNSMHHQGVIFPGKNLRATSWYGSIIESTENDRIITSQFHPEFMGDKQSVNFFNYIREWIGE